MKQYLFHRVWVFFYKNITAQIHFVSFAESADKELSPFLIDAVECS